MSLLTLTKKSPLGENLTSVRAGWRREALVCGEGGASLIPDAVDKVTVLAHAFAELEGRPLEVAAAASSLLAA